MCKAVNIIDTNAIEHNKLTKLQLILGKDSYKEILKLNNGEHPDIVRTYELVFHTQDSDEWFKRSLSISGDEINFAYRPIELLPGPKDQNTLRVFSLNKYDITDQGILIPEYENYAPITKVSWKDIVSHYEMTES